MGVLSEMSSVEMDVLAEGGMGNVWGFVFTSNKQIYFSSLPFQYFGTQL